MNNRGFKKNDPWFIAKLAGINAKSEQDVNKAKQSRQAELAVYNKLKSCGLHPDRYTVFKKSIDGLNITWGHRRGVTLSECQDLSKYPAGTQKESGGPAYVWTHCLTDCL